MRLSYPDSPIMVPMYGFLWRTSTTIRQHTIWPFRRAEKPLPVTFKFGSDEQPEYHTFTQLEELKDFYTKAVGFIQTVLAEGWEKKGQVQFGIISD